MTVTTTTNKAVYQGNGATTVFGFNFSYPNTTSIQVSLVNNASGNTTIISPINYTVTGLTANSGQITYPLSGSPIAVGTTIVIERLIALTQQTDFTNQGAVYPKSIEAALDYLTMEVQQVADKQARTIVFSAAETASPVLPVASARANLVLGFDGVGNPIAVSGLTTPGSTVSAAMIPVVTAPTTLDALTALGIPGALLDLLIPAGTLWDYALQAAAPTGFVFPIGQVCTSSYPVLRAALLAASSPYGLSGADPLFPDLRGRVATYIDGGTGRLPGYTLGVVGGNFTRTLVAANLPPITPIFAGTNLPSYNLSLNAISQILVPSGLTGATGGGPAQYGNALSASSIITIPSYTPVGTISANGGTSTPVSVMQPTIAMTKIMKAH